VTLAKRSGFQSQLNTTLKQFIEVRWDTRLDMLDSIQKNYEMLKSIALNNDKVFNILSKIDEKLLKNLIDFLYPLKQNGEKLCKEKSSTLNKVLSIKYQLINFYRNFNIEYEISDSHIEEVNILKSNIITNIEKNLR